MSGVVLLDLDGCLVDSTDPIQSSLSDALAAWGLEPVVDAELRTLVGPPLAQTVPRLLIARGRADLDPAEVIARYRELYATRSIGQARSYPGMPAAVGVLHATHRLGVVTSKPRQYAEPILAALALHSRFEVVEAPDSEIHSFPTRRSSDDRKSVV